MRRTGLAGLGALAGLLVIGFAVAQRLEPVTDGLSSPVAVTSAGDGRLYLVEQAGTVRVVADGRLAEAPFLDLRDLVSSGGERGLLGLAFAPDYAATGRIYLDYTDLGGNSVLARYHRAADGERADPTTAEVLIRVAQPYSNHNGGGLTFGPDGYLYWGLGDGGSGGDPHRNGQNPSTLLGSVLRLDVSGAGAVAAADNPFVGRDDARPEVWIFGVRNPWRFSFDRDTGDLYIGDVGQNAVEEIDRLASDAAAGANLGWNVMEGDRCYRPPQGCSSEGLTAPIAAYPHEAGWGNSVTGGYVYRGSAIPSLRGTYLFADFGSGRVWAARQSPTGGFTVTQLLETGFNISTFGQDDHGELYLVDYGGGVLYKLVP